MHRRSSLQSRFETLRIFFCGLSISEGSAQLCSLRVMLQAVRQDEEIRKVQKENQARWVSFFLFTIGFGFWLMRWWAFFVLAFAMMFNWYPEDSINGEKCADLILVVFGIVKVWIIMLDLLKASPIKIFVKGLDCVEVITYHNRLTV